MEQCKLELFTKSGLINLASEDSRLNLALVNLPQLPAAQRLAETYLHPAEMAEYEQMRHPGRRREWLGARVCLKTMLLRHGQLDDPRQCEVRKDLRGRPSVIRHDRLGEPGLDCSLAHKDELACAAWSNEADAQVGIDIERISPRLTRLAGLFTTDRDTGLTPRSHEHQLTIFWALKEAYSKSVGLGLGVGLPNVACIETSPGRHSLTSSQRGGMRARHIEYGDYVVAWCLKEH